MSKRDSAPPSGGFFKPKQKFKHLCGNCNAFRICSKKVVKFVRKDTDACQWEEDYYVEGR